MSSTLIFILNQVPLAVFIAVAYFLRDRIAAWADAKSKHGFDKKLEGLKADLAEKGREIDALRSAPLNARAARQAMIDKRKLEAIDQLWGAVKIMQPGKAAASWLSVLNWEAAAEATKGNPRAQDVFRAMGGKLAELYNHDAHAARPYLSPLASALFSAYSLGIGFVQARMMVLQTGVGKDALSSPEPVFKLLIEALPNWKEYIEKYGASGMQHILDELEKRLLTELQRNLEGKDDDKSQVEHAARIAALAREADRKLNENAVPEELRAEVVGT